VLETVGSALSVGLESCRALHVVLVQARVVRRTKYAEDAEAISARKLVDKTSAPVENEGTEPTP